VEKFQQQERRP